MQKKEKFYHQQKKPSSLLLHGISIKRQLIYNEILKFFFDWEKKWIISLYEWWTIEIFVGENFHQKKKEKEEKLSKNEQI